MSQGSQASQRKSIQIQPWPCCFKNTQHFPNRVSCATVHSTSLRQPYDVFVALNADPQQQSDDFRKTESRQTLTTRPRRAAFIHNYLLHTDKPCPELLFWNRRLIFLGFLHESLASHCNGLRQQHGQRNDPGRLSGGFTRICSYNL